MFDVRHEGRVYGMAFDLTDHNGALMTLQGFHDFAGGLCTTIRQGQGKSLCLMTCLKACERRVCRLRRMPSTVSRC